MASESKTLRKAAPPPPPPAARKRPMVNTAGKQEDFAADAADLAAKLGWDGPDHYQIDGLTVRDARRFIQKTLHEAFVAGALGGEKPDGTAASVHLAVDTPDEVKALSDMLALAFEAGKGATVEHHRQKNAMIVAEGEASAGSLLARVEAHELALKEGKN